MVMPITISNTDRAYPNGTWVEGIKIANYMKTYQKKCRRFSVISTTDYL
jgi:hypothetical protein